MNDFDLLRNHLSDQPEALVALDRIESCVRNSTSLETFWLDYSRSKALADAKPLSKLLGGK